MKKTGRILFSMAAAGTAISAAAFAVKKYNDRCGKPASDMERMTDFGKNIFPIRRKAGLPEVTDPVLPQRTEKKKILRHGGYT